VLGPMEAEDSLFMDRPECLGGAIAAVSCITVSGGQLSPDQRQGSITRHCHNLSFGLRHYTNPQGNEDSQESSPGSVILDIPDLMSTFPHPHTPPSGSASLAGSSTPPLKVRRTRLPQRKPQDTTPILTPVPQIKIQAGGGGRTCIPGNYDEGLQPTHTLDELADLPAFTLASDISPSSHLKPLSYLRIRHGVLLEQLANKIREQDEREKALDRDLSEFLTSNGELWCSLRGLHEAHSEWKQSAPEEDFAYAGKMSSSDASGDPLFADTTQTEASVVTGDALATLMYPGQEPRSVSWDSDVTGSCRAQAHPFDHARSECPAPFHQEASRDLTSPPPLSSSHAGQLTPKEQSTVMYTEDDSNGGHIPTQHLRGTSFRMSSLRYVPHFPWVKRRIMRGLGGRSLSSDLPGSEKQVNQGSWIGAWPRATTPHANHLPNHRGRLSSEVTGPEVPGMNGLRVRRQSLGGAKRKGTVMNGKQPRHVSQALRQWCRSSGKFTLRQVGWGSEDSKEAGENWESYSDGEGDGQWEEWARGKIGCPGNRDGQGGLEQEQEGQKTDKEKEREEVVVVVEEEDWDGGVSLIISN